MNPIFYEVRAEEAPHEVLDRMPGPWPPRPGLVRFWSRVEIDDSYANLEMVHLELREFVVPGSSRQYAFCVKRATWPAIKERIAG